MCGIFVSLAEEQLDGLDRVLPVMNFRGPDSQGSFFSDDKLAFLGHVRLSIFDITAAAGQPMFDSTKRFVVVFNGEIYNFPELKRFIEAEYSFSSWRSNSDTEILIEGFAHEGKKFLKRLNGFFALTILDRKENRLYILRDPLGIKPLYQYRHGKSVIFSSDIKPIRLHPGVQLSHRINSFASQLKFMYVPEPFTLYNEITKVKPGTLLVYDGNKKIKEEFLFGHLFESTIDVNQNEALDLFDELFSAAVQRQVNADVPVSIMLSGGIDSSAIAVEASKHGIVKEAYSIAFQKSDQIFDNQFDDFYYASLVANHCDIKLNRIDVSLNDFDILPEIIKYMDDGFTDPASVLTFLISKQARQDGYKVLLSGQGADEFLGGYRRYVAEKAISMTPRFARSSISGALGLLPTFKRGALGTLTRRLKHVESLLGMSQEERIVSLMSWVSDDIISDLISEDGMQLPSVGIVDYYNQNKSDSIVEDMMILDQQFDLLSLNLAYSDHMSMANSVETRVPFLDFELVRLYRSLPLNLKIKKFQTKYILRQSMEDKLPTQVMNRSKAGFGVPLRSWLRESGSLVKDYLNPERIKDQGLFNPDIVRKLLNEHFSGGEEHSYLIFTMLAQQIWLDSEGN